MSSINRLSKHSNCLFVQSRLSDQGLDSLNRLSKSDYTAGKLDACRQSVKVRAAEQEDQVRVNFKRISVEQANQMMSEQDLVQIVDIRDDQSFNAGHIPDSVHLHGSNIEEFMAGANPEAPLLVVCYHGISSQSAAAYLAKQGFRNTYSLDGGFQAWLSAQGPSASS